MSQRESSGFAHALGDLPTIHLHPGQLYVSSEQATIATVLGSCVAVCVWSSRGFGGMNHYLLPYESEDDNLRFAGPALRELKRRMSELGSGALQAKIFGGAGVLGGDPALGQRNVQFARKFLSDWGVAVAASDTGGQVARKLVFFPGTGEAWVRRLQ